jgi:hypothetical protein
VYEPIDARPEGAAIVISLTAGADADDRRIGKVPARFSERFQTF